MLKKIVLFIGLCTVTVNAQHTVTGSFSPSGNYSWIMLYQLRGAKQVYITNGMIEKGKFSLQIPKEVKKGMLRLVYSMDGGSFDFIYDKEDIEVQCNPNKTLETLQFLKSKQNALYYEYLKKMSNLQYLADSLQVLYFKNQENKKVVREYKRTVKKIAKLQATSEKKSKGMRVHSLIKSNDKYYPKTIVKNPQEYLNNTKEHFFDKIDFFDENLKNSTVLSEKVIDYIFGLHTSDDVEVQNKLYKKATEEVLKKVQSDALQSKDIQELLLFNFSTIQNIPMVDYLMSIYKKLPKDLQDTSLINDVEDKMRLAIGKKAPNFTWEKDEKKSLYQQKNAENYLLVFWSTTCSHCLKEIPQLYDYTKNDKKLKVIAVALEDDELGFNYYSENYPEWTNILSLGKWKNGIAQKYKISATPTYFVLDSNKKIVATPEFLKDVKEFLKNNTN